MFYTIISILTSLFAVVMTIVMLFSFRKPRRITALSSLSSAMISFIMPVIFLAISGVKPDLRLALPFFSFGLLLGFLRGLTMELEFVGDQVVGRHSILFLLMWGLSLALNQALSTLDLTILLAVGLVALFLSTGTQVGFYGILAVRRLAMLPPELDTGKFRNQTLQRMVSLAFGGLLLIFLLETLLISIPAMPFLAGVGVSPLASGEEMAFSPIELEEETQTEEIPSTPEPYFTDEQVLVWTRPLAAFLMESEHVLYAFNVDGSGVTKVYDEPLSADDSPAPQISPDGSLWIVTSQRTGDYEQYLMTVNGSRTYQLRYLDTIVTIKDWSPDGSQILVVAQPSGSWDVLVTDREGVDWQVLANQGADEVEPRWSPDGEFILYLSDQDGNQEIYRVGLNGGEPINLTRNPAEDKRASWVANGTRIVFTSDRDGIWGLYNMNRDGGDLRLIAQDLNCGFRYQLSPDGEQILYTTDPYYQEESEGDEKEECRNSNRYLSSLTSGETITLEVISYNVPLWSPDGSKILYSSPTDQENDNEEIFVIYVNGTGRANLNPDNYRMFSSIWSPDSTHIAQIYSEDLVDGTSRYVLSIMDANGENRQELASIPWEGDIAFAFMGFSWP